MKNLTATLSDLSVHDATLYGFATFSDGHTCRVRFSPSSDVGNGAELYRRAGKWRSGEDKWELIEFGNANDRRLAAVVEAASPIYAEEVEKDRLDRLEVAAENERRDLIRAERHFQQAAGPALFALLDRIANTADVSELFDDDPELASQVEAALAAGRGVDVKGNELPCWQYRAIGAEYWTGAVVRAPDAETARADAALRLHDGRDKFGASRAYLPEEVEVRLSA